MKIVFIGTSKFAATILNGLSEAGHDILAVVTQMDKKRGRRLRLDEPPVKREAARLRLDLYQPADIADKNFIERLKRLEADFFVVAAYGRIFPAQVIAIPKYCCLNAHASLLPKYRGAAPLNWAIINGEEKTGLSVIMLNEKMDAGDIVLQKELTIRQYDTSQTLEETLAGMGALMLSEAMKLIANGRPTFKPQDHSKATYAPKLKKEDGRIKWDTETEAILNRIRGLKPWPGTYTFLDGRLLKVISAEAGPSFGHEGFSAGQVIAADEKNGLLVKTKNGSLSVNVLQLEARKELPAGLFLRGRKIASGTRLDPGFGA